MAFALNVWNNPHILIMDEPTNHLDLDAVNALIIALNMFLAPSVFAICSSLGSPSLITSTDFYHSLQEYTIAAYP